jgi:hypothetical protein
MSVEETFEITVRVSTKRAECVQSLDQVMEKYLPVLNAREKRAIGYWFQEVFDDQVEAADGQG